MRITTTCWTLLSLNRPVGDFHLGTPKGAFTPPAPGFPVSWHAVRSRPVDDTSCRERPPARGSSTYYSVSIWRILHREGLKPLQRLLIEVIFRWTLANSSETSCQWSTDSCQSGSGGRITTNRKDHRTRWLQLHMELYSIHRVSYVWGNYCFDYDLCME